MKWIKLNRFTLMSGYTSKAVYNKIERGKWEKNIHWRKAPDGRYFINPKAIEEWIEGGSL